MQRVLVMRVVERGRVDGSRGLHGGRNKRRRNLFLAVLGFVIHLLVQIGSHPIRTEAALERSIRDDAGG